MAGVNHIETFDGSGTYTALGFRSAKMAQTDGVVAHGASGDRNMLYDRGKLLNQSRWFYDNNAIYKGMIDRAIGYIVGNGFTLQMATKNKSYNNKVEKLWKDFWKKPEVRNILSGRKSEKMVAREMILCGDTGFIQTNLGLIQHIEAEQIVGKSPNIDGIEKDRLTGRPISYSVSQYNKMGRVDRRTARKLTPKFFNFITDPTRPSATRGVPASQAAFPMLHRINDVCDSEAIAWQLLARLAVSIVRTDGPKLAYDESREDPKATDTAGKKDLATRITDMGYALMFQAKPGEEVKGIDRNLPGKDFPASIRMFLRLLGLPLGLPLEIVLLDWTKSNYSQSRAVLEQAYLTFQDRQATQCEDFLDPILEWKLKHWTTQGLITPPKKGALNHVWVKPTFPWIDQLKEAKAWGTKVDRGFATHNEAMKSLNMDREQAMDIRQLEVEDAIARAKKIENDTGTKVPWEIFAGMEPASKSVVATAEVPEKEEEENAK